ncbi:hypothetical protein [Aquimarina pacifica]|uniref:hypothetical protein n=1 Tax=Aquimarina pacifica TaxID=1296415 RepID=UPI0004721FD3|nr:hypothetical protein [Aquimarina pacifica]
MTKKNPSLIFRIFKSHTFSLIVGILLILVGIIEICETVIPEFESFLEVHHGILLIGVTHVVKALIYILEGTEGALITEIAEEIEEIID